MGTRPDTTEVRRSQLIRDKDKKNLKYRCFKCKGFMNSPHETKCCSKGFCQHCIEKSLNQASQQGPTCPNPECKRCNFEYYRCAIAKGMINDLPINCKYTHLCRWTGTVGEHEKHLLEECKHHKLQCEEPGCDVTFFREEKKAHIQKYEKPHQKFGVYEAQIAGLERENAGLKTKNAGLKKALLLVCCIAIGMLVFIITMYICGPNTTGSFNSEIQGRSFGPKPNDDTLGKINSTSPLTNEKQSDNNDTTEKTYSTPPHINEPRDKMATSKGGGGGNDTMRLHAGGVCC